MWVESGWERLGQSGGERGVGEVGEIGEVWDMPRCKPLLECVVCGGCPPPAGR